ncbi:MAG: hypothetical protein AVO33_08830 [delta proteobacterium ML8_F1]|nr:MAG: hypothetical protein AVO33_08830 [delta proteobacterium ML8_F1]
MKEKTALALCQVLDEKQGRDIVLLDVSGKTPMMDYFIIVTAMNPRHGKSLADALEEAALKESLRIHSKEGMQKGEWILLDFKDIVVHIFTGDNRRHYDLEKLWYDAKKIEMDIDTQGDYS